MDRTVSVKRTTIYCIFLCHCLLNEIVLVFCQPPEYQMIEGTDLDSQKSTPGVHHEFKINVGPGQQECFYQNIKKGANLHIAFEVSFMMLHIGSF